MRDILVSFISKKVKDIETIRKFYIYRLTNMFMVSNTNNSKMFENIFSYPQLDTVIMVEHFIEENSAMYKKKALWKNLPKKIKYKTLNIILDYLEHSYKIAFDREGKIVWIGYEPTLLKNSVGLDE